MVRQCAGAEGLFVYLMSRNPVKTVFNYPPAIIERCRQLGLVDDSNLTRIPAIELLQELAFRKPVTFFVSENGTGAS